MKKIKLVFAIAVCSVAVTEGRAALILVGNHPEPDEQNVLLNNGDTGAVILGSTNQTDSHVRFTGEEILVADASGQAVIESQDGFFTFLRIDLLGDTFRDLIVNLDLATSTGGPPDDGSVTFTTVEVSGGSTVHSPIGIDSSGNNFFTLLAEPGDSFTSIEIRTTLGVLEAVVQPRISGVASSAVVIPEASSIGAWGICALLGVIVAYRRRSAFVAYLIL